MNAYQLIEETTTKRSYLPAGNTTASQGKYGLQGGYSPSFVNVSHLPQQQQHSAADNTSRASNNHIHIHVDGQNKEDPQQKILGSDNLDSSTHPIASPNSRQGRTCPHCNTSGGREGVNFLNRRRRPVNEVYTFRTRPTDSKHSRKESSSDWNDAILCIWLVLAVIYVGAFCVELRAKQIRRQCKQKGTEEPNWVKFWI